MARTDYESQTIDNPLRVNKVLSFLIYGTTAAEVEGLDHFPRDQWPSTLPLLFYSYHIMVGLGTWFGALMAISAFYLWRIKLDSARWILWCLLLWLALPGSCASYWASAVIRNARKFFPLDSRLQDQPCKLLQTKRIARR
ncbi:cytochrome ubiquinol oxidase subunit I [Tunturiibacter empetritectus]|uniref:cytochrome ubiquinol oxidase subunit I n=1 Tax=Tunturiibacter empetritectus TaxID=3069691 RepID=UPI003D9B2440